MIMRYVVVGILFFMAGNNIHADLFDDIGSGLKKAGKDIEKTAKKVTKEVDKGAKKVVKEADKAVKEVDKTAKEVGKEIDKAAEQTETFVKEKVIDPLVQSFQQLDKWILPNPNKRFDEVTYLGAHNAHANVEDGFALYNQQVWSIKKQLEKGVRHFLIDVWPYKGELYLCHGGCDIEGSIQTGGNKFKTFKSSLETFKDFLDKNPKEIISLEIESYATSAQMKKVIDSVKGLSKYLLTKDKYNPSKFDGRWPRLKDLHKDNTRLIIFDSSNDDSGDLNSYGYKTSTYLRRNMYGTHDADKACEVRGGKQSSQKLNQLNYFGTVTATLATFNTPDVLKGLWSKCLSRGIFEKNRPNFLALDFVDKGNAMRWVNELNK